MEPIRREDDEALEAYLDGRLSAGERESFERRLAASAPLREYRDFVSAMRAAGRRAKEAPSPPGLADRVMDRVFAPAPPPALSPRAWALAAACLVLGVFIGRLGSPGPAEGQVRLWLDAPRARQVAIVGDFTDWKPVPLTRRGPRWEAELELAPGRYQYAFIVNEKVLVVDPRARELEKDARGRLYSVLDVMDERL